MLREWNLGLVFFIGRTLQLALCLRYAPFFTQRKSEGKQKRLCLRQDRFHGEISALVLAFMLAHLKCLVEKNVELRWQWEIKKKEDEFIKLKVELLP